MCCRDLVPISRTQEYRNAIGGRDRATVTDAPSNRGIRFRRPVINILRAGAYNLSAVYLLEPEWLFGKIAHLDKTTSIFGNVLGLVTNVSAKIQ